VDDLQIRHVEPLDYEPIISVVDEWWGGRRMADMLPKLFFVHFRNTSFVAEREGSIVGFLIGFISQAQPQEAYVHFVGVHPLFRKLGLGKVLYLEFFSAVMPLGCSKVRCVTSPINKSSIAFHKKMGFSAEKAARIIDGIPVSVDYDGKGEDRVLFTRTISNADLPCKSP
jgi:ribosomal protein S18 acetylase RimI-like enzyme